MLVPFVIDADSLAPDPSWPPSQQRACHNNLFEVWQSIGLLAYDGEGFANSKLQRAVLQLPQNLRILWMEVLPKMPLVSAGSAWDGTVLSSNLTSFSSVARLALVDDTKGEVEFGLDEESDEKTKIAGSANISICRLLACRQATLFKSAISSAGTHIEAGDTFQITWDTRFKILAHAPLKKVSLVDRYSISQHVSCPQTKLSGLERFLRLLDGSASGPRHVTVFSAWTGDLYGKLMGDIVSDIKALLARLPKKNIKRLKLHMVPNTCFRDDGHDRFVRFDDYVWDIGLGTEVFEGAYAAKRSSATFKTGEVVDSYKQVERDLAGNTDTKMTEIT